MGLIKKNEKNVLHIQNVWPECEYVRYIGLLKKKNFTVRPPNSEAMHCYDLYIHRYLSIHI